MARHIYVGKSKIAYVIVLQKATFIIISPNGDTLLTLPIDPTTATNYASYASTLVFSSEYCVEPKNNNAKCSTSSK